MEKNINLTILSEKELFDDNGNLKLKVFKQYGTMASGATDFAKLTGAKVSDTEIEKEEFQNGVADYWYVGSFQDMPFCVSEDGSKVIPMTPISHEGAVRPVLKSKWIYSSVKSKSVKGENGILEVEFGEYPQSAPKQSFQEELEEQYQKKTLPQTGFRYTIDATRKTNPKKDKSSNFTPEDCEEYEYKGKKYIRVDASFYQKHSFFSSDFSLSNGETYKKEMLFG